jgi:hypothetical protein
VAGKPVADLLYQVVASSGSFDPTQQKLILEGVVGVITALKIDPATDAKFARRCGCHRSFATTHMLF